MPINILLPISILPGEYLILPLALKYTQSLCLSLCLSHYFVSPVRHPRAVLLYSLSQWLHCDDLLLHCFALNKIHTLSLPLSLSLFCFSCKLSHPRAILLCSLSQWLLCDDLFRTILETLHTQNKIGSFTQTKHLLLFLLPLILSV